MSSDHCFEWPSVVVEVDEKIFAAILLPMAELGNKKATLGGGLTA